MQIPLYREVYELNNEYQKRQRLLLEVGSGHLGLYFDKFFDRYNAEWQIYKENKAKHNKTKEGKLAWIKEIASQTLIPNDSEEELIRCKPCGNEEQLTQQQNRLLALADAIGHGHAQAKILKTTWHFATGLGLPHPVENGVIWHPTLGVPYLPASSIKGLLKTWQRDWTETSQDKIDEWFGTQEKAGKLIFFDAIPIKPVTLIPDVMTPHYGKWYEKGNTITNVSESEKIPADWHNPVPVPFLAIKEASFLFVIVPRKAEYAQEAKNAMEALTKALEGIGAGAKTAVGYGCFEHDEQAQTQLTEKLAELEKQQEEASLSPEEKTLRDVKQLLDKCFAEGKHNKSKGSELSKLLQTQLQQALNWNNKSHQQQFAQHVENLFEKKEWGDWWKWTEIKKPINALKSQK